jgi:hypothetical protein
VEKGLGGKFFKSAREHLDAVAAMFHISPAQAAIFALLIEDFDDEVSIQDIAKKLKCGKMKRQISELSTLLREENFSGIQKRLKESGMRTGIACLFFRPARYRENGDCLPNCP